MLLVAIALEHTLLRDKHYSQHLFLVTKFFKLSVVSSFVTFSWLLNPTKEVMVINFGHNTQSNYIKFCSGYQTKGSISDW